MLRSSSDFFLLIENENDFDLTMKREINFHLRIIKNEML